MLQEVVPDEYPTTKCSPLEDNISSVELINLMGTDLTVVNAARVSLAKSSDWEISTNYNDYSDVRFSLKEADTKLIKYLASHGHWTPFAQPQVSFRIKMPIFVARQWYRHTIGFVRNETSRRYVSDDPEFYIPTEWRGKPIKGIKQGSNGVIEVDGLDILARNSAARCFSEYKGLLMLGVAPEMARMILPQNMYTEFIETASLYAYARLCRERLAPDAQKEIRVFAEAISDQMRKLFPVSWEALLNN